MNDIFFKKSGASETIQAIIVAQENEPLPTGLRVSVSRPKLFSTIQQTLLPKGRRFAVRTAARNQAPALPLPEPVQIALPMLKPLPRLASGRLYEQLSTPMGKLLLVQGAALIALFGFVAYKQYRPATIQAASASTEPTGTAYRAYLPTVPSTQSVNATSQALADASSASSLPLEVWATPWNLDSLTGTNYKSVSAFWGTVGSDGISIQPKADWQAWDSYVAAHSSDSTVYYLTVSGDPSVVSPMLQNASKQSQQISALLSLVQQHDFDGIDIDYEGLGVENRTAFTAFIQSLASQFHAADKKVAVTVEASADNDVPMDWQAIGQSADEVRVMAYDYHSQDTGTPGPIAPIGWIQDILQYAQNTVPASKLVIGLGNYGYDWTQSADGSWTGTALSTDQATALAKQENQTIVRQTGIDSRGYDIGSVPEFKYTDPDGQQHDVWFEDQQSLQAKETLVEQYHPAGVIFWTVGLTDPSTSAQQ